MKEEIAAAVEMPRPTVIDKINKFVDFGNIAKSDKTIANHDHVITRDDGTRIVKLYEAVTRQKESKKFESYKKIKLSKYNAR